MENSNARNYTENPIVQLAFENIRHIQDEMRRGFDAEQDIASLLVSIPSDILADDKDKILKLFEELKKERQLTRELPPPPSTYQWSRKHIEGWRYKKFVPARDAIYKQIINVVVNRLHKTFDLSRQSMESDVL